MKKTRLCFLFFLCAFLAIAQEGKEGKERNNGFDFNQWKEENSKKIDINEWRKTNPVPWGDYFNSKSEECAEKWFFTIGPLGIIVYMHDAEEGKFPNLTDRFPRCLTKGGKLQVNALEVTAVQEGSPAFGKLNVGDLITEIDGQKLISGAKAFPDMAVLVKDTRSLEISVGQLVDLAEGKGNISLTVLRLNDSQKNQEFSENVINKSSKKISFKIPKIGSFGEKFSSSSHKLENYSKIIAHRLSVQQEENGSWSVGGTYSGDIFHTSICGLGLLSTGDKTYDENIKKAAYFIAHDGKQNDWSYPAGMSAVFLGEYYLRTKDKDILKPLQTLLERNKDYVLPDHTAGHKYHPGYGGCGWIGGGGAITLGYAIAAYTPVGNQYLSLLDKMLLRAQEISPDGVVPYGRVGYNGLKFNGEPAKGQDSSATTGPYYLASMLRGTSEYFAKIDTKRYGTGPWGNADGGHATHTLQFFFSSLSSAMSGNVGLKGNMEAFFWKFVTYRNFDGLIGTNMNRLEYHGAETVLGLPYWQTGSILTVINAHKRNMAITGNLRYKAKDFKSQPLVSGDHMHFYNFTLRSWQMVSAALGKKSPKSVENGLKYLRKIKPHDRLASQVFEFLNTQAISAAKDIRAMKGIKSPEKFYYMEMLLGIGAEVHYTAPKKDEDNSSSSSKSTPGKLELYTWTPESRWDRCVPEKGKNPTSNITIKGKVILTNIKAKIIDSPISFEFEKGIRIPREADFLAEKDSELKASYTYSCGDFNFSYSAPVILNSTHPMHTYINERKIWVPGSMNENNVIWKFPLKLGNGQIMPAKVRESHQIKIHRNNIAENQGSTFHLIKGTPCDFLLSTGDLWEPMLYDAKVKKVGYGILKPDSVTLENGKIINGKLENLFDEDMKTNVEIRAEDNSKPIAIDFHFGKQVIINSMAHYVHGVGSPVYELQIQGKNSFIPVWWGALFWDRHLHNFTSQKGSDFRLLIKSGNINFKELHFHK